jgi:2-hydroxy-3-keto-5-methylthiopentenyl-1-phosphate phosphatase
MNYRVAQLRVVEHMRYMQVWTEQEKVILVDLDGTISHNAHRQHFLDKSPKDWDGFNAACVHDEPNEGLIRVLIALAASGKYMIHIVSGRSEGVREETIAWLEEHSVPYDILTMRMADDFTEDSKLKRQWLENFEYSPEMIEIVFDDRQRVVDMWREQCLLCCQVAPGDF